MNYVYQKGVRRKMPSIAKRSTSCLHPHFFNKRGPGETHSGYSPNHDLQYSSGLMKLVTNTKYEKNFIICNFLYSLL